MASARGTEPRNLTGPGSVDGPSTGDGPAWSPDELRIVYTYTQYNELYLIGADGKNPRLLLHPRGIGYFGSKDWSPDGRAIAFSAVGLEQGSGIYTIAPDGTRETLLIPGGQAPSWSPDGTRLALSKVVEGRSHIFVADADGRRLTQLTHRRRSDFTPSWSPDGRQIAFVGETGNQTDIYVMNADGTGLRNLTRSPLSESGPDWQSTRRPERPPGRQCALIGSGRRDRLRGSSRDDIIAGGQGGDVIRAGEGVDSIDGGEGSDWISGGGGADVVVGGSGSDAVLARDGRRDQIFCGPGRDRVEADGRDRVSRDCERVIRSTEH
jgi:Tol biopolymer transport system component